MTKAIIMEKVVFLDRDGVICEERIHLHRREDFKLIDKTIDAIKLLNKNNYRIIIISNQSAIAKGICTQNDVENLNNYMRELLNEKGAKLDKIYFCPHHPKGNNPIYTKECECRKPKPGMILQAQKDFNIKDLSGCYIIGDKMSDIYAGKSAGCKTILVKTGYGGKGNENLIDIEPSFHASDLYDAVANIILKNKV